MARGRTCRSSSWPRRANVPRPARLQPATLCTRLQRAGAAMAEYMKYRDERLQDDQRAGRSRGSRGADRMLIVRRRLPADRSRPYFGILLTRSIAKPLRRAVAHLDEVASGDLTKDAPAEFLARGDEIGLLAKAKQTMIAQSAPDGAGDYRRDSRTVLLVGGTVRQFRPDVGRLAAGLGQGPRRGRGRRADDRQRHVGGRGDGADHAPT